MENQNIPPTMNRAPDQPRKKLWHGLFFGLGCGTFTMIASFVTIFTIVLFYLLNKSLKNFAALDSMTADEIRQSVLGTFALVITGSFVIALIAGVLGGRAAYRHSSDSYATRRLFISTSAGLGISVLLFLIGFFVGLLFEDSIFSSFGMSFGEGTFSFYVLFPLIPGTLLAFIGGLLGTILVFRRLLSKSNAVVT